MLLNLNLLKFDSLLNAVECSMQSVDDSSHVYHAECECEFDRPKCQCRCDVMIWPRCIQSR